MSKKSAAAEAPRFPAVPPEAPDLPNAEAESEDESADQTSGVDVLEEALDAEWLALAAEDPTEEAFFSTPPSMPAWVQIELDASVPPPQPQSERMAMIATLGMLAFIVFGLGGFLLVSKVLMPTPAPLGADQGPILPTPDMLRASGEPSTVTTDVNAVRVAPGPPVSPPTAEVTEIGAASERSPQVDGRVEERTAEAASASEAEKDATPAAQQGEAGEGVAPSAAAASPAAGLVPRPRHSGLIGKAYQQLNRGNFREAERLAARATVRAPRRADAWMVLAAARDAQGDAAGAQRAYRMCVVRVPSRANAPCKRLRK